MLTGLVWAGILMAVALWFAGRVSPQVVLRLYKARALSPGELPELREVVRRLAHQADLPAVPRLYYVPSKIMNAFAVGTPPHCRHRRHRRSCAHPEPAPARRRSRA